MYKPSISELCETFRIDDNKAEKILQVFQETTKSNLRKLAEAWNLEKKLQYCTSLVDMKLALINCLSDSFGVEAIRDPNHWDNYYSDCIALYVNTGESYCLTLVYDIVKNKLVWTSYADFIEQRDLETLDD